MEHYKKGNIETFEDQDDLNLPDTTLKMRVNYGSKIDKLTTFALKKYESNQYDSVAWYGCDRSISKAISCAEIMKRHFNNLNQITYIGYKLVCEKWIPKIEGLEELVVKKKFPRIVVALSKNVIEHSSQQNTTSNPFWEIDESAKSNTKFNQKPIKKRKRQKTT